MSKPAPFPHTYEVQLAERTLTAPPRAPIAAGSPPQFGGSDQVWSPEELLIAAALECLWTTFEAYARKDQLEVKRFAGRATGILDRAPGTPAFTSITLVVDLVVPAGDEERARKLVATAEDRCIISRALRVPVTVEARVEAG
jgi:osmotically inducible protein OsmC